MYRLFLLITVGLFSFLYLPVTLALAADCTIVYGGGQIDCPKTSPTPTMTPAPITIPQNPTQTKGGLPIQQPTHPQTTPPTGPEALGIISLLPMAAGGVV